MAFQNEEDYLDSLLKSIANGGNAASLQEMQEDVPQIDEDEFVEVTPEEAGVQYYSEPEVNVAEQIYSEPEINVAEQIYNEPEESLEEQFYKAVQELDAIDDTTSNEIIDEPASAASESWKDVVTVGDVLEHETDIASEFETVMTQENVSDGDDSEVDEYIQNLLNQSEEDEVPSNEAESFDLDVDISGDGVSSSQVTEVIDANDYTSNEDYDKALENLNASVEDFLKQESESDTQQEDASDVLQKMFEEQSLVPEEVYQDDVEEQSAITEEEQPVMAEEVYQDVVEEQPEINEEAQTEQTEYIDITNNESDDVNDLLGMIDGIISDVEQETELEAQNQAVNEQQSDDSSMESQISFSDVKVDDELKELLGDDSETDITADSVAMQLSDEELQKLAEIEAQASEQAQEDASAIDEQFDEEDSDIKELMSEVAAAGIDVDGEENEDVPLDLDSQIQSLDGSDISSFLAPDGSEELEGLESSGSSSDSEGESDNNAKNAGKPAKGGLLAKILSLFKKNKGEAETDGNENQQVLDELFDENGELKAKDKKAKKKGLFGKKAKSSDAVETPIDDDDLEDIPEVKEKKKKEKKKKEPKEKKPKKPKKPKKEKKPKVKKPKVKKEKPPVNPNELIHVKPVAILIIILVVAIIAGGAYLLVNNFIYEQAYDNATSYMLDKRYNYAYDEIAGVTPKNEEDEVFCNQVQVVMYLQKELNSFDNYFKMGLHFDAIDSLIHGLTTYDEYYSKAEELGVLVDFENVKAIIISTLEEKYGITEAMARSYAAITDYGQYVYILESYGGRYQ